MRKRANQQHIEPIRIRGFAAGLAQQSTQRNTLETEANCQHLLLQRMTKLVSEQKESNRLLRKIAGETDYPTSKTTIFISPKKNMAESIVSQQFGQLRGSPHESISLELMDRKTGKNNDRGLDSQVSPIKGSLNRQKNNNESHNCNHSEVIKKMDRIQILMNRIEDKIQKKNEKKEDMKGNSLLKVDPWAAMRPSLDLQMEESPNKGKRQPEDGDFNIFQKGNTSRRRIDASKLNAIVKSRGGQRKESESNKNSLNQPELFKTILNMANQGQGQGKVEKEAEQKKNYSVLSEILPYSDRREIKIKFSVLELLVHYKNRGDQIDVKKITEEWLGLVYRATASICWNMLSNNLLSFDQTKILFTENIIYNFIEFMKTVRALGYESHQMSLVQTINSTSVSILDFLCTQYPQTKVEDPNIALRSEIPFIDNKGRAKYDVVSRVCRDQVVVFKKKESGDYTSEIMRTINFMIEKTNQEFNSFYDTMANLFGQIFLPIQKRGQIQKEEENHDDQIYFEKVKSYTKFLIGRKINKNTPFYAEPEIQNGIFLVKSPSILRIITKWVEQLDQMIRKPESEIKNAKNEFKDHEGKPMHLYGQVKNALFKKIKEDQGKFEEKVREIKKECYNMEVLLTLERFTTDPNQIHLSEEQISVGKYCTYLKSAISSYICSELNEVIDFLLRVPQDIDETKIGTDPAFQQQSRKDLDNLNLVTCKVFDLLRCKCISKESEIVYLLKKLKDKNNDSNDPFKIVRIKDRLNTGTRDILINATLGQGGLVCEIQLAVTSNIDKKQELLDQYNHFLYELKRAKLGSITENASIWSALEQRGTFFQSEVKKDRTISTGQQPHPCISDFRKSENRKVSKFLRPIICASCNNFFEIPKTCLSNIKCDNCQETYCGECHFAHLKVEERKEYVFQKNFFKSLFSSLTEYRDFSQPLPRFGFLIRKFFLKKELFYFRVITKKSENIDSATEDINIQLVTSAIENGALANKVINKVGIEANQVNGQIFLHPSAREQFDGYLMYSINLDSKIQKVTLTYKQLLQNFNQMKVKFVNLMRHPAYIQNLKIIKKPKLILREISSFKSILQEDTKVTYLKLHNKVFIAQVDVDQDVLRNELVKVINLHRLKTYAIEKVHSVSLEFRGITDQMSLIKTKFPPDLMASFSKRLTKLYLNFGNVQNITFLTDLPNVKVLFLRENQIVSLQGVENLHNLKLICFDKNKIQSLEPLAALTNLTQISGASNCVQSLNGIQNLTKLKKLNLFGNEIPKIEHFQGLTDIKELTLGGNPISVIEGIFHLSELQDLSLGMTNITDLEPLAAFPKIKKLALNDLNLTAIGTVFRSFDDLLKLNLSNNAIESIENLDEMTEIVQLSLRNNKLRTLEGLASNTKLQVLKVGFNFITDIAGIRLLENLRILKIQCNPLDDCSEFHMMNRKHLNIIFTKPGETCPEHQQPTALFYERYNNVLYNRNSSSGSNSSSGDDDDD